MGSGRWSGDSYNRAASYRSANMIPDFKHDDDVKKGRASGIHPDLDPKRLAGPTSPYNGKPVRESRDSEEHPNSVPVVMIFDVTGSMGAIPRTLQTKLTKLMDVILEKAGLKDPQILVGAIGDATVDKFPLQVGQFESDNRFDEQLRNIILEGGGGGQVQESYALAYRFLADHTAIDSFEKRGKKGYFFMIGDEAPWEDVSKHEVSRIFGVTAQEDESIESLLKRAGERWEIFHLFALDGSYPKNDDIKAKWRALLPERLVLVEDSALVCEVVAGLIHMMETSSSVDAVVKDVGVSGADSDALRRALVPVAAGSSLPSQVVGGDLPPGHVLD